MAIKTIKILDLEEKNIIPMIWIFLYRFPYKGDVEEDYKTIVTL